MEECELVRSDLLQNDLDVEGEFVSEQVMKEEWEWSEFFGCNELVALCCFSDCKAGQRSLAAFASGHLKDPDRGCQG